MLTRAKAGSDEQALSQVESIVAKIGKAVEKRKKSFVLSTQAEASSSFGTAEHSTFTVHAEPLRPELPEFQTLTQLRA